MSCLAGETVGEGHRLLDKRYFFVDREGRGHTTCGFARKIAAVFLRNGHVPATDFLDARWRSRIDFEGANASVLRFFVEQVLLSHMATFGCPIAGQQFKGKPRTIFFQGLFPNTWEGTGLCLHMPLRYNYPAVDAVFTFRSPDRKFGKVAAIQITIASSHSNSEDKFFETWRTWSNLVECSNIEWVFLWVVASPAGKPVMEKVKEVRKRLRGRDVLGVPEYQRVYASVSEVDPEIGSQLEDVRGD